MTKLSCLGNNGFTVVDQTTGAAFVGTNSNTASGWLAGAGIEYAFTNNWTGKIEYDYIGLPGRTFVVSGAVFPAVERPFMLIRTQTRPSGKGIG